ncbi:MAG TPA: DUF885 domain-containing protein [Candidatus Hydrogenedentes bacterium]|nr:DUF885 domain-containing protein [Candidatus Hydrogenedentota bacterium]
MLVLGLTLLAGARAEGQSESDRLNEFFEESFQRILDVSPMYQSSLGIKKDYDKWDDLSEAAVTREFSMNVEGLARLRSEFDYGKLDDQAKISYRLFEEQAEQYIERFPWRKYRYLATQMRGLHASVPSFLINTHRVSTLKDAQDYVRRLEGIEGLFDQLIVNINEQADLGIIAPKFVFEAVIEACANVIRGEPFSQTGSDSTLLADLREKIAELSPETIPEAEGERLIAEARMALLEHVEPAYGKLIETLTDLEERATDEDGAWKFPEGDIYYRKALQWTTTTDMPPDEIHDLGLAEMDRIHTEMRVIMNKVRFRGSLSEFFDFTRTDPQFFKPNTEAGKQEYLDEATAIIDTMRGRLDEMFLTMPEARIDVKRVEAFREKSAGKAFYQRPAPDGSRPGTYYANLRDMADMPLYQMEALAYHEGIPGHHMQVSIAQELEGLPKFRKYGRYTAYIEGWGLYSETSPKEMGMYQDPYSDFGRLAMELWRAARLVVDTGLHHKRWTRQEAIDYLVENTPNPEGDCIHAIERYIVMPSQATAYKIGMIKIMELRRRARQELASYYHIREFHDAILKNGALPLDILDEQVTQWIERTLQSIGSKPQ